MTFHAGFVFLVVAFAGRTGGAETRQTVADWNNEGAAAFSRGDWVNAERLLSAAAGEAAALPDPLVQASIQFNLGALTKATGRYTEAEQHYLTALRLREGALGNVHISLVPLLRGFSLTLLAKGDFEGARTNAVRAVRLAERQGGHEWALALSDLARVQIGQSDWNDAAGSARLALQNMDPNDGGYAELLTTLGVIARQRGSLADAEHYAEQAGSLLARTLGDRHPSTAAAWNNLAEVKVAQGKPEEAMTLLTRAIDIWVAALGPNHPNVAIGLGNQGQLALSGRHYAEAQALFLRALALDRSVFGEQNVRVAMDWNNLGSLAVKRKRFHDATGFYERALASTAKGQDEKGLVSGNLAVAYCHEKRWVEAAALLADAAAIRERIYGTEDAELGSLLEWEALALRNVQDFGQAAQVEVRATRIRVKQALRSEGQVSAASLEPARH